MIEQAFVPVVVALTTALAFAVAVRRFRWPARAVVTASGKVLECVGIAVVFCLLNAVVGAGLILAARVVSGAESMAGRAVRTTLSVDAVSGVAPADAGAGGRTNAFHSAADASRTTSAATRMTMRRSSMRAICERTASRR